MDRSDSVTPESSVAGTRPSLAPTTLLWLTGLVVVTVLVSVPVLPGVLWALMIGYWTFPAHRGIAKRLTSGAAAALSTFLLVFVAILPTVWLIDTTQQVWTWAQESLPQNVDLVLTRLHQIAAETPYVGRALQNALPRSVQEIDWVGIGTNSANAVGGVVAAVVLRAGDWVFHVVIAIGTLFFVYRDGADWWAILRAALRSSFGKFGDEATKLCASTASAVTRGVILTAVVQGVLAGFGYWAAGAPQPLLLAVVTVPAAIVPLGAGLVWVPAAAWLALTGHPGAGLGLALYGAVVVGMADNGLRPILMRENTPLTFWPLTLSIVGGTLAFGVPGVYVGPMAYALARLALFRAAGRDPAQEPAQAK
ncbi:MAG: AI-2E family transporter [Proteobacteria bacterium]|nr:AI-2E family transporter [Burkholderiales bacterium]